MSPFDRVCRCKIFPVYEQFLSFPLLLWNMFLMNRFIAFISFINTCTITSQLPVKHCYPVVLKAVAVPFKFKGWMRMQILQILHFTMSTTPSHCLWPAWLLSCLPREILKEVKDKLEFLCLFVLYLNLIKEIVIFWFYFLALFIWL